MGNMARPWIVCKVCGECKGTEWGWGRVLLHGLQVCRHVLEENKRQGSLFNEVSKEATSVGSIQFKNRALIHSSCYFVANKTGNFSIQKNKFSKPFIRE